MSVPAAKNAIAAIFERLAADTDDDAWWRAAVELRRPKRAGRREIDDRASLAEMASLIDAGEARSPEQAAGLVAPTLEGEQSAAAATARLARKFREIKFPTK